MDTGEDKNNYLYFYIFLQKITCSVTLCLLKGNLYFHVPLYSKMAVDWFLVTGGTTVISTLHNYPIDAILFFWSLILSYILVGTFLSHLVITTVITTLLNHNMFFPTYQFIWQP